MASMNDTFFRPQLEERRQRLRTLLATTPPEAVQLERLLGEVDAALARVAAGSFGVCETCHDPIEPERLIADPLLRFCLDHLTAAEQRALEQDLRTAARIQHGLLPPVESRFDGWEVRYHWEPAGLVSGDYCDVVKDAAGGGFLFVFGDVAGKGVAAAMLMSHLHATFRSLLGTTESTSELVERANRVFRDSALSPHFATLVCGRALPGGVIEICNAGHCQPRLISAGAGARVVDPTGLPVGAFYSSHFTSVQLQVQPGEALLLYTDGLTEARDREGREYGEGRLEELLSRAGGLSGAELLRLCRDDLDAHLGGDRPGDDLTLMVVQRRA
jgi:sigma-B regulation protein RsbU (phosphoserine phosphatase)